MIEFRKRGQDEMDENTKQFIGDLFYSLCNPNSFAYNLNMLYNNSQHFMNNNLPNLCTQEQLCQLSEQSLSSDYKIVIEGSIHSNSHTSSIIHNMTLGSPVFVQDDYVRFRVNGSNVQHILVNSPKISSGSPQDQYTLMFDQNCGSLYYIVNPRF
jgi:hypothetical protein